MRPYANAFTLAVLVMGGTMVALCGYQPPTLLLVAQSAFFAALALAYGFTLYMPGKAEWLWLKSIRGTVCICLGVGAMYVPPQLVVSAFFIGVGTRMVWLAACEEAEREGPPVVLREFE